MKGPAGQGPGALPPDVLGADVRAGRLRIEEFERLPVVGPSSEIVTVRADRATACIEVFGVARYRVESGLHIVVDVVHDANRARVQAWLYGTVAAFVAAQQGRFALHASVVDIGGRRIAVAGDSGVGKSTTVLAVAGSGGALVSDDVAVIDPTPAGGRSVPFGRPLHVARDAAEALAVRVEPGSEIAAGSDKITIQAPDAGPGALRGVVALQVASVPVPRTVAVDGLDAVHLVRRNTFRRAFLGQLYADEMFGWQVAVAKRVPTYRLVRPDRWSVAEVAAEVTAIAEAMPTPGTVAQ